MLLDRKRGGTLPAPPTALWGPALPPIPYCYLDVAHRLLITNSVPSDDVRRWWDEWNGMLTAGSGSPTGAGYTALKELSRTLDARADAARGWLDRSAPNPLPSGALRAEAWLEHDRRRQLRDEADGHAVMELIDSCGFSWDEARARVVEIRERQSNHAIGRALVLAALIRVYEDFGVHGAWEDVRARYPNPEGRAQVADLPPLPETVDDLLAGAPRDFTPRVPAEVQPEGTIDLVLGASSGDGAAGVAEHVADLFARSLPPRAGVPLAAHQRTLAIGRALADDLRERGELRTFTTTKGFLEWAKTLVGAESTTTPRSALEATSCIGKEGKSGVGGQGVGERVENTYRYFLDYGPSAAADESEGG